MSKSHSKQKSDGVKSVFEWEGTRDHYLESVMNDISSVFDGYTKAMAAYSSAEYKEEHKYFSDKVIGFMSVHACNQALVVLYEYQAQVQAVAVTKAWDLSSVETWLRGYIINIEAKRSELYSEVLLNPEDFEALLNATKTQPGKPGRPASNQDMASVPVISNIFLALIRTGSISAANAKVGKALSAMTGKSANSYTKHLTSFSPGHIAPAIDALKSALAFLENEQKALVKDSPEKSP